MVAAVSACSGPRRFVRTSRASRSNFSAAAKSLASIIHIARLLMPRATEGWSAPSALLYVSSAARANSSRGRRAPPPRARGAAAAERALVRLERGARQLDRRLQVALVVHDERQVVERHGDVGMI